MRHLVVLDRLLLTSSFIHERFLGHQTVSVPERGPRNTEAYKIQSPSSQRSQALEGLADKKRLWPCSILHRERGSALNAVHVPVSWCHSSSEEWLLISSKGFLLRGKCFKIVLAVYWSAGIVFPATEIPLPEVVMDQNHTN